MPWIFTAIKEEDVVTADVGTSVMSICFISLGDDLLSKDTLTVVGPEAFNEDLGAHRVVVIWGLEETKFVAVLIRPLSR